MARALPHQIRIAAFAVVTLFASLAHADPECVVRFHDPLVAADERAAWGRAVHEIERSTKGAPGDCSSVDVRVDGGGASIELRTLDGREAERHVRTPAEVGPLVRALLTEFTDVPEATPEPIPPYMPPDDAAPPAPMPPPQTANPDVVTTPARPRGPEVFAAVGAGLKVQTNDGASPVGQAMVGISVRAWQIGAFARLEFEHHQDSDAVDTGVRHTNLGAGGGGAMFGRRQSIGPVVILFGGSLALYSVEQERGGGHRNASLPHDHVEADLLDPRSGLYFGCLIPTTGRIRTRVQIDGEVAFIDHSAGSAFPNVPQWGMGLTVGIDFGLLP